MTILETKKKNHLKHKNSRKYNIWNIYKILEVNKVTWKFYT